MNTCESCVRYDGDRCTKDWNNLDPSYYIPERDDKSPADSCDSYQWDMTRKKYDHKAYQNEYHKAMKTKLLSFNPNNEVDMRIWDHLMSLGKGNVFPYIKRLILEDMEGGQSNEKVSDYRRSV